MTPDISELVKALRGWAKAYRDTPEHRFPSDPNAEFFPFDLDAAADALNSISEHSAQAQRQAEAFEKLAANERYQWERALHRAEAAEAELEEVRKTALAGFTGEEDENDALSQINNRTAAFLTRLKRIFKSSDGIAEGREAAPGLPVANEHHEAKACGGTLERSLDRIDANPQGGAVAPDTCQPAAGVESCPSDATPVDPVKAFAYLVSKCASSGLLRELIDEGRTDTQARNQIIHYFLDFAAGESCRIARRENRDPRPEKWAEATRKAFERAIKRTAKSSDGGVEGHAPEGSATAAASGLPERRPRDMEAAGWQREAETGRSPEMARVREQASNCESQDSDRIAGPTAARGRAGVEPGPSEAITDDVSGTTEGDHG